MARRNESPEGKRRRELVQGFLKENPVKDPNDIQELMKEMMRQVLQGGLSAELDEEVSVNTSAQIPSVPEGSTQAAWVRSVAIW